ncbi:hypothetical protein CYMTET_45014 [Cymbomonas tetramitiformis]|uniref:Uncharacterized protein n=1 Tax=Cymbomonas tetramitiformis TaxID=36881 RepID=A0AAE0BZ23_9CHLO|nr:hypothetical protein CYMTET_45014 [Cymbomonas tetramitiformis]
MEASKGSKSDKKKKKKKSGSAKAKKKTNKQLTSSSGSSDDDTSSESDSSDAMSSKRKCRQRDKRKQGKAELRYIEKQLEMAMQANQTLLTTPPPPAAVAAGPSKGLPSKGKKKKSARSSSSDDGNFGSMAALDEKDVAEKFKAAAGTKQLTNILRAVGKLQGHDWDNAKKNGGMTRPQIVKHAPTLRAALEELFWGEDKEVDELEVELMMVWRFAGLVNAALGAYAEHEGREAGKTTTTAKYRRNLARRARRKPGRLHVRAKGLGRGTTAGMPTFSQVASSDYSAGLDVRAWLEKAAAGEVVDNEVTIMPGVIDSAWWKMVTFMFGHNEAEATTVIKGKRVRCIETLAECVQLVKRRAVRLCFQKGVTQPKLRGNISLAAKKVYGFVMKGVYPLKLPPSQ